MCRTNLVGRREAAERPGVDRWGTIDYPAAETESMDVGIDRQQIIAIIFVGLMVVSAIAYSVSAFT
jgi:hypothetical protein